MSAGDLSLWSTEHGHTHDTVHRVISVEGGHGACGHQLPLWPLLAPLNPLPKLLAAPSPFYRHCPDLTCPLPASPGQVSPGCHQREKVGGGGREGFFSSPSYLPSTSSHTWPIAVHLPSQTLLRGGVLPPPRAALSPPHPTEPLLSSPGDTSCLPSPHLLPSPLLSDVGAPNVSKKTDVISSHKGPVGTRPEKAGGCGADTPLAPRKGSLHWGWTAGPEDGRAKEAKAAANP